MLIALCPTLTLKKQEDIDEFIKTITKLYNELQTQNKLHLLINMDEKS